MFLIKKPTKGEIEDFIQRSQRLPLSYPEVGIARRSSFPGFKFDETSGVIGYGRDSFEQARKALTEWRHFELAWVEQFPKGAEIKPGNVVAVVVRHLGFWSINGCRVVYRIEDPTADVFGFAYGTLINHAEMGEEIFEVTFMPDTAEVIYSIRAVSKPRAALAWLGYPFTRLLQKRFRRDSIAAMRRVLNAG